MHKPAQSGGDGWGFGIPHIGIAHKSHIARKLSLVGFQEWNERWRTRFLFAFDEKEFTECSNDIATALGIAVDPKIYIPLLIKHVQYEVSKNSLKSLKNTLV